MEKKKKLSVSTGLCYAGGDVGCNIVFGMIGTLLTLFYTDYVGISAATVGLVMLLSRCFDGFSDLVMGVIVERTNSKWGKSRPWLLWMSIPFALSAVLLFTVPHTTGMLQFLYLFVTYNFCTTICYTAINLPYGILLPFSMPYQANLGFSFSSCLFQAVNPYISSPSLRTLPILRSVDSLAESNPILIPVF